MAKTRKGTVESNLTRVIESDPTGVSVESDPTREVDPTREFESDPTRGGVGVDILNGALNSNLVTLVDGERGGGSGEACPSDPDNV